MVGWRVSLVDTASGLEVGIDEDYADAPVATEAEADLLQRLVAFATRLPIYDGRDPRVTRSHTPAGQTQIEDLSRGLREMAGWAARLSADWSQADRAAGGYMDACYPPELPSFDEVVLLFRRWEDAWSLVTQADAAGWVHWITQESQKRFAARQKRAAP